MANVFPGRPGQVLLLDPGEGDLVLPLALDGVQGSWFPSYRAILTGMTLNLGGNQQFVHTLRDVIYVYVFGDRISEMSLTGLAFAGSCDDSGGAGGVERVLELYSQNRVAARADPVQLQIGVSASGRFRGYLTDFRADIVRPEARISQFTLGFKVIPGKGTGSAGGPPGLAG